MQIIPVIDLKDGLVVHAKHGLRDQYMPINSPLCTSNNLDDVIAAYLSLHKFKTFYLADLNAIGGNNDHHARLEQLLLTYPHLTFWIDSGFQTSPSLFVQHPNYIPVLGSESYTQGNYRLLKAFKQRFVLSLDFSGVSAIGAASLFEASNLWPENIIIMSLQRVGSNQGPDLEKLQKFVQKHSGFNFIAAGGIRDSEDLNRLTHIGIYSALLASALHSGAIKALDLQVFETVQKTGRNAPLIKL